MEKLAKKENSEKIFHDEVGVVPTFSCNVHPLVFQNSSVPELSS